MSILSSIGAVLQLIPGVTKAIEAVGGAFQRAARPKPTPIPFGRAHAWGVGLREPPLCAYCGQEQTEANALAPCPGPAKAS